VTLPYHLRRLLLSHTLPPSSDDLGVLELAPAFRGQLAAVKRALTHDSP
jgi:hypothetical protein